jgi:protein-S-isoprenylcysteine O-methyltransferase Ste14
MTSLTPQPPSHLDARPTASAWSAFQQTKFYDLLAGLPLIAWFGFSASRQAMQFVTELQHAQSASFDAVVAIGLLGKAVALAFVALLMAFVLIRRPAKAKARGLMPRVSAFFGTYLGLAIVWLPPQPMGFGLSLASLLLMLGGLGFSVYALSHLGRSFSVMAEARRLVIDGPYARVRHPLYLGEAVAMLGLTLQYLSGFALLIFSLQMTFQIIRIRNEEAVLATHFPEYADYRTRTARLVPHLF